MKNKPKKVTPILQKGDTVYNSFDPVNDMFKAGKEKGLKEGFKKGAESAKAVVREEYIKYRTLDKKLVCKAILKLYKKLPS